MLRSIGALLLWWAVPALAQMSHETVDGPDNAYTTYLTRVLARWKSPMPSDAETSLECLSTPGVASYVGLHHHVTIQAPLAAIDRILGDIDHYRDLIPDTIDVRVLPESRHGDTFVASWTQRPPVFFLPDVTYELANRVDRSRPGRIVYRYKLRRGDRLLASDGMLILEASSANTTRFEEFDFFQADWGPLPIGLVWRESVRGAYGTDIAIQLKAEHPEWSYSRLKAEGRRMLDRDESRVARCVADRRPLRLEE